MSNAKKTAAALGNFDGMHRGHTAVLEAAKKYESDGLVPLVVLFDEHSLKELTGQAPPSLMTSDERDSLIRSMGFDIKKIKFSDVRNLSAEEFVNKVLVGELNAGAAVCGFNYSFGKGAEGDSERLKEICAENGLKCTVVDEIDFDGQPVCSTAVRRAIENGELERANAMLGRRFGFTAEVIGGDKRGRTWGFPTINQLLPENSVMPKFGVYASDVIVDGERFLGVTNIGKRPTVGTPLILSETNIIDFNRDVYGKRVEIRLRKFLREEKRFDSFEELARQIDADVAKVRNEIFDTNL